MGKLLDRFRNTPDDQFPDDDHPNRPNPFTEKEMDQIMKEIVEAHENDPLVKPKPTAAKQSSGL
jgi:hypothetical protein